MPRVRSVNRQVERTKDAAASGRAAFAQARLALAQSDPDRATEVCTNHRAATKKRLEEAYTRATDAALEADARHDIAAVREAVGKARDTQATGKRYVGPDGQAVPIVLTDAPQIVELGALCVARTQALLGNERLTKLELDKLCGALPELRSSRAKLFTALRTVASAIAAFRIGRDPDAAKQTASAAIEHAGIAREDLEAALERYAKTSDKKEGKFGSPRTQVLALLRQPRTPQGLDNIERAFAACAQTLSRKPLLEAAAQVQGALEQARKLDAARQHLEAYGKREEACRTIKAALSADLGIYPEA